MPAPDNSVTGAIAAPLVTRNDRPAVWVMTCSVNNMPQPITILINIPDVTLLINVLKTRDAPLRLAAG